MPRDDDFRCPGCETPTRAGSRYCARCLAEGPGREPADARDLEGDDYYDDQGGEA